MQISLTYLSFSNIFYKILMVIIMQRYFVDKIDDRFILSENDFHHIKNVMRIKENDNIICVYDNRSYLCKIQYTFNTYQIIVEEEVTKDVELNKEVLLYQALIKNDKFDLVVQKATELGTSKIIPTIFNRSIIKIDSSKKDNKLSRYEKIVKEACEQSHRQSMPMVCDYINVKKIKLDDDTLGLMAYENNGDFTSLHNTLKDISSYKKIAIVIGPEGGFCDDEVNYLTSIGFKNVSLGKRILRSETASMFLLSVVSHYLEGM